VESIQLSINLNKRHECNAEQKKKIISGVSNSVIPQIVDTTLDLEEEMITVTLCYAT
jgi:hypothetical protein